MEQDIDILTILEKINYCLDIYKEILRDCDHDFLVFVKSCVEVKAMTPFISRDGEVHYEDCLLRNDCLCYWVKLNSLKANHICQQYISLVQRSVEID